MYHAPTPASPRAAPPPCVRAAVLRARGCSSSYLTTHTSLHQFFREPDLAPNPVKRCEADGLSRFGCRENETDRNNGTTQRHPGGMAAESKAPPTLYEAAKRGALEEVESLLATKPPAESFVDEDGRPALSVAAAGGHVKVVKSLLDGGAEDKCVNGWTAACHAAYNPSHRIFLAVELENVSLMSNAYPRRLMSAVFLFCNGW